MKYIISGIILALTLTLVIFSGCVTKTSSTDDITNTVNELDKQTSINNTDNQITNDLDELNYQEPVPEELKELDNELEEIDALLNEEDPFAELN